MKYLIKVLISLVPLFITSLVTNEVSANSDKCQQVRAVRRLAIRENLDDESLATLEYRYCANVGLPSSVIQPSPDASPDCIDLTVMTLLAQMSEGNSNLVRMVKAQREVACRASQQQSRSSFDWSNGQSAKFGSSWYYPNGEDAKFASSWYYPNGEKAKFASSWYYPNGERASTANSLFAWACDLVGRRECENIRFEDDSSNNLVHDLTIIELFWQVYQFSNSQN